MFRSSNPIDDDLTDLAKELKLKVSSFLSTKEVSRLARTCKTIHSDLALSTLSPPFRIITSATWSGEYATGDIPRFERNIPILFCSGTHTIRLHCSWRDQAWGFRKGQLYIVGHNPSDTEEMRFSSGRLVVTSPIVEHHEMQLSLSFQPRADEIYHLWYSVGGGGGHELFVENLVVYSLIHDNEKKSCTDAFQCASAAGLLDPLPRTNNNFITGSVQATVRCLLGQMERKEKPDAVLSHFLEAYGLRVEEESLIALEKLASLVQDGCLESPHHEEQEEGDDMSEDGDDWHVRTRWLLDDSSDDDESDDDESDMDESDDDESD